MATNHYKGQSNRISEDELPDDVQAELSATFSPDVIYALLRDAYYRGPVPVGKGGERRVYGGGTPGTGLRRPDGPLYNYPESWRNSVLGKATDLDLLVLVEDRGYAATERGLDLLLDLDRCPDCGRVNRPTLKNQNSSRRLTVIKTECPVHGNGGGYERDLDEVPEVSEGVVYRNDDSVLDEADPEGLRGDLSMGDRVEVLDHDKYAGRQGTVIPSAPVEDSRRSDDDLVHVYLDRDEDGYAAYQRRSLVLSVHRNVLRDLDETGPIEVPVFAEGQVVTMSGEGMDTTYVVLDYLGDDYYRVARREDGTNAKVLYAWQLEQATRLSEEHLPETEFDVGDEVRLFDSEDEEERDRKRGVTGVVAEVRPEDYSPVDGWTYVVEYEKEDRDGETVETWAEASAGRLEYEEVAAENDPDPPRFSPGDVVHYDADEHGLDEETEFVVVEDRGITGNPYWTGEDYLYSLRPTSRRRTRSRREEMDAYERHLSPVEE